MSAKMIDASEKRKLQLGFELRNSRVFEKRNNQTPYGYPASAQNKVAREAGRCDEALRTSAWEATIIANKRSHWLPERARYTLLFQDVLRWFLNKQRFSRSCNK